MSSTTYWIAHGVSPLVYILPVQRVNRKLNFKYKMAALGNRSIVAPLKCFVDSGYSSRSTQFTYTALL